jgi:hypothetical protein
MYKKICPTCGNSQFYKSRNALWLATKNNSECRKCATLKYAKRKGTLISLLSENLISYYWLGFLLADGHISNNRLTVSSAIKDEDHLKTLAILLETSVKYRMMGKYKQCALSVMDTINGEVLVKKYNILSNKTINPPNILQITGDPLIALSIGFIDGDGCIKHQTNRKDFTISVKCHSSWLDILKYLYGKAHINKDGYAITNISNTEDSKKLKAFVIKNHLPVLKRKWDIINLEYRSRQAVRKEKDIKVKEMLLEGMSRKKIKKEVNLTDSGLSQLIKKLKYETTNI